MDFRLKKEGVEGDISIETQNGKESSQKWGVCTIKLKSFSDYQSPQKVQIDILRD